MRPPGPNDAADLLLSLMEEVSESSYAAGWTKDLEYDLWRFAAEGEQATGGYACLGAPELKRLEDLSSRAGGWWRWDESENDVVFVSLDAWRRAYSSRVRT